MMEKNTAKYFVDVGLLISFLAVVVTGIMKFWIHGRGLLSTLHDWSGVAMAALVLLHLVLNVDWIAATTKSFCKKEEVAGKK